MTRGCNKEFTFFIRIFRTVTVMAIAVTFHRFHFPRSEGSCENIGLNEFNLEFSITSNVALYCQHLYSFDVKDTWILFKYPWSQSNARQTFQRLVTCLFLKITRKGICLFPHFSYYIFFWRKLPKESLIKIFSNNFHTAPKIPNVVKPQHFSVNLLNTFNHVLSVVQHVKENKIWAFIHIHPSGGQI